MRDPCVCARSHGHSARNVATSSSSRAISRAEPAGPAGARDVERGQVVGLSVRSRSHQPTRTTCSSGRPRWASSTTSGATRSSSAKADSLISDSRACDQHCATRCGPRSPVYCQRELLGVHQAHARRPEGRCRAAPRPGPGTRGRERRSGPPWGRRAAARRFAPPPGATRAPHRRSGSGACAVAAATSASTMAA